MRKLLLLTLAVVVFAGAVILVKAPSEMAALVRGVEGFAISQYGKFLQPAQAKRERLAARIAAAKLRIGQPVFIRIFKLESILELWLHDAQGWRLFESFPICRWSGKLGPKLSEGDLQAPEGFYEIARDQLNPASLYHLAMNIGYPNDFDRAQGRTGSAIMIHGNCVSIGCFAMTDAGIDDIYALTEAALAEGQGAVPVHIFPFRMTEENLSAHRESEWLAFWQDLKLVHDRFEASRQLPLIAIHNARYTLR